VVREIEELTEKDPERLKEVLERISEEMKKE
jgi:hypothetical protein